jgi:transcriptional regulator with XRE-family HTH domain
MRLSDYMALHGLTKLDVARAIGSEPAVVSRYLLGRRRPSAKKMALIYQATNGAVGPADFYDLLPVGVDRKSPLRECAA